MTLLFTLLSSGAALDRAWLASLILGAIALLLGLRTLQECGAAMAALLRGFRATESREVSST